MRVLVPLLAISLAALLTACGTSTDGGAGTTGHGARSHPAKSDAGGSGGGDASAPGAVKQVTGGPGSCPSYDVAIESVFVAGTDCDSARDVVLAYMGSPLCRSGGGGTCQAAGWTCDVAGVGAGPIACTRGDGRVMLALRGPR